MDTFRKWLNKPKADDKSLLARFYHADRSLTAVASELDSFDGRAEPDRCSRLVSRLRQGQDKVLSITNLIMKELLGEDRDARAFRAKFPEEVLQENLAGQLWFGAECLAAGSSIMNREQESKEMRPLAQAVTKSLGNVRNLLRDQCLRSNVPNSKTLHLDFNDAGTEQLYESLKIFDRLFAEFELRYVSAMVQVKSKHEYEMQELIGVLLSETLQRALKIGLVEQDKVDAFDPALMFSIPRLAIITGLVIYPKGPLNMDMAADQLSEMFRPFRTILIKIRDLLRTLSAQELSQLEKLLCTNEDIHLQVGTSSIEAPSTDQQNNNADAGNTTTSTTTNEQQRSKSSNNNLNTNATTAVTTHTTMETQAASTSPKKKVFKTATGGTTDSAKYAARFAARSPSITSSVSADSSMPSTPTASPSPSPTPSHSLASTSSAVSKSNTWSDEDCDIVDENDEDTDNDDDVEDDNDTLPIELDIESADCASGFLIPNTNFGNLLQPQEVPLTDNFIASEDEFGGNQQNSFDEYIDNESPYIDQTDEDLPTTSAASSSLRLLRLNSSSEENNSEQLTIKASTKSTTASNDTLSSTHPVDKADKVSTGSSSSGGGCRHHSSSSNSCSSRRHRSCTSSCTSNGDGSHRTHRRHSHHGHHHHHHHHSQHSKEKHSSSHSNDDKCTPTKLEINTKTPTTTTSIKKSPQTAKTVHHDTSSVDSSTSSSLSDGDPHEVSLALRAAGRMKFKSTENLLHRLFVCIAGVADQLQTNFAPDLRQILRSVFLINMSTAEYLDIPEKTKESELFEFRASENDVIQQQSAGSNQSIYSAEEVNPELDNVFNNSSGSSHSSSAATMQRGNTIDLGGGGAAEGVATDGGVLRNHVGRSRSLGDQENNEANTTASSSSSSSSNRRLSTYISGRRLSSPSRQSNGSKHLQAHHRQHHHHHHHQRNRNNSVGSNSNSSSPSESNSPVSERASVGFSSQSLNANNNNFDDAATTTTLPASPMQTAATTTTNPPPLNMRLAPPAWVPDDKAPRCMSCHTPFTAFRRRHHCRNCGGVFCGVCSNATAPLPKYGLTKAVRVCRECFTREVRANSAAAASTATRNSAAAVHAHQTTTTAGGS